MGITHTNHFAECVKKLELLKEYAKFTCLNNRATKFRSRFPSNKRTQILIEAQKAFGKLVNTYFRVDARILGLNPKEQKQYIKLNCKNYLEHFEELIFSQKDWRKYINGKKIHKTPSNN